MQYSALRLRRVPSKAVGTGRSLLGRRPGAAAEGGRVGRGDAVQDAQRGERSAVPRVERRGRRRLTEETPSRKHFSSAQIHFRNVREVRQTSESVQHCAEVLLVLHILKLS